MSTFLLYFPGAESEAQVDLASFGLDLCLPGSARYSPLIDGPDKGNGMLACFGSDVTRPRPFRYAANAQTWRESPEGYWAGYVNDAKPKPFELVRDEPIKGYPIRLSDGNDWTVPVVRCFWGQTNLPNKLNIGPDYQPVKRILPQYAALGEMVESLWDGFGDGGVQSVDDAELMRVVCAGLAVNYWGNLFLFAGLLDLFDELNLAKAAYALVDQPRLDDYLATMGPEKKNQLLELSKPTAGCSVSSETHTQHLQTFGSGA